MRDSCINRGRPHIKVALFRRRVEKGLEQNRGLWLYLRKYNYMIHTVILVLVGPFVSEHCLNVTLLTKFSCRLHLPMKCLEYSNSYHATFS